MGSMDGEEQVQKAYEAILMHDFERAMEWFEQAIAINPDNAVFHYKLSITCARSNKLSKAIEHAKEAVNLDAKDPHFSLHLQHLQAKELIHLAEGYFTEPEEQYWYAIALLKQAIRLDSLSLEAFLLLAHGYSLLKYYKEAIEAVRECLKLDPQHETAQRLLREYQQRLREHTRP
jgi:tetratricopeptide (TPR) repeat protein